MVRSAIDQNRVAVRARLTEELIPVLGDRVQLQQVVMNLILNAIEAMSSDEEGARELSIRTEQDQTNGVLVAVQDSGPGIDPEHVERVFDALLHHQDQWNWDGAVDMPVHHRRPRRSSCGRKRIEPQGAVFQFTLPAAHGGFMNSFNRLTGFESRTKATFQMVVVHRLTEVTKNPLLQGSIPDISSGYAVTRIVGIRYPASTKCLWSSIPVIPGI